MTITTPATVQDHHLTDVADHPVAWPADMQAKDIVIVMAARDAAGTFSWAAGFTELLDTADTPNTRVRVGAAWYRSASGGETGDFLVTAQAQSGGAVAIQVRGAHETSAPEVSTAAFSAVDAAPDPPSFDPSWDASVEETLWIPFEGHDGDPTTTGFPYAGTNIQAGHRVASGAGCAACSSLITAASVNPGAFTLSAINDWVAAVIAVRPAPVGTSRQPPRVVSQAAQRAAVR